MKGTRTWRSSIRCSVLVLALAAIAHTGSAQEQSRRDPEDVVPAQRMVDLFDAMRTHRPDSLRGFFPADSEWTYHHATHTREGIVRGVWRIPSPQTLEVLQQPLRRVFFLSVHAQPIGWLAHQVLHRGRAWRPVSATRFVPPGANRSSPVFVQWRLERGAWVIDAVGDEAFAEGVPLPPWCC